MFCSRCGKQVDESNRFCQTCGQEIGTVVSTAPSATGALPPPIATSAQVSPPLMYAGFWERVAAYLIDGLIIGIPAGIVLLALIFMFGGFGVMLHRHSRVGSPDAAGFVAPIFFILLSAMFFSLF